MRRMCQLLLSAVLALAFATQVSAFPKYLKALKEAHPDSKCETCHVKATGGERTAYGKSFEKAPEHKTDAAGTLKKVGAPK